MQAVETVCWVVIVTNSFNLLDNMDGLAAGVAAVSSIFLFAVALENGQFILGALALGLAGCAIGFLRYNFHPARIYMGDSGSLFLGFVLAVLSLDLRFPAFTQVTFVVPVLIVGVALFDTTLVSITRLIHGRTPLQGGLDHVSHRLVFVGLSTRAAVCLLYAVAVALGGIALVITRVDLSVGLVRERSCGAVRPPRRPRIGPRAGVREGWHRQSASSAGPDPSPGGSQVLEGLCGAIGRER